MIQFKTQSMSRLVLVGCLLVGLTGCGGESGPHRSNVRGNVTYKGKPVPKGLIRFTPDQSRKNEGPGAAAEIIDGFYETSSGRGVVSGPHTVLISGFDGVEDPDAALPDGAPLFGPFTTKWDFEEDGNSEVDFEVPLQK